MQCKHCGWRPLWLLIIKFSNMGTYRSVDSAKLQGSPPPPPLFFFFLAVMLLIVMERKSNMQNKIRDALWCREEEEVRRKQSSLNPVLFTWFVYHMVLPALAGLLLLLDHQPIFDSQTPSHLGQVKGLQQWKPCLALWCNKRWESFGACLCLKAVCCYVGKT